PRHSFAHATASFVAGSEDTAACPACSHAAAQTTANNSNGGVYWHSILPPVQQQDGTANRPAWSSGRQPVLGMLSIPHLPDHLPGYASNLVTKVILVQSLPLSIS